ncbi:MAG: inorganic pyrophosphatase [Pyrinomonadaceae bacterium]
MDHNFTAHPWHGISPGQRAPREVVAFIEIVPSDTVKYELDKESGIITIDRPQQFSNVVPANYGFIPKTFCGDSIAELARGQGASGILVGDADPLDILVLSEHHIPRGSILVNARPIGGFCLVDNGEADDKIVAVLKGDKIYEQYEEFDELPDGVKDRMAHYFLTYKNLPGEPQKCEIANTYGKLDAHKVIETAFADYRAKFGLDV